MIPSRLSSGTYLSVQKNGNHLIFFVNKVSLSTKMPLIIFYHLLVLFYSEQSYFCYTMDLKILILVLQDIKQLQDIKHGLHNFLVFGLKKSCFRFISFPLWCIRFKAQVAWRFQVKRENFVGFGGLFTQQQCSEPMKRQLFFLKMAPKEQNALSVSL